MLRVISLRTHIYIYFLRGERRGPASTATTESAEGQFEYAIVNNGGGFLGRFGPLPPPSVLESKNIMIMDLEERLHPSPHDASLLVFKSRQMQGYFSLVFIFI